MVAMTGAVVTRKMPVFVVALGSRLPQAQATVRLLHDMGIEARIFPGVVPPKDLAPSAINTILNRAAHRRHHPLTTGEVGCYFAHYRALASVVRDGLNGVVMLESDALLRPAFKTTYESLHSSLPFTGLAAGELPLDTQLHVKQLTRSRNTPWLRLGQMRGATAMTFVCGTSGYWMDRRSVILALSHLHSVFMPIDEMLSSHGTSVMWQWAVRPRDANVVVSLGENMTESAIEKQRQERGSTPREARLTLGQRIRTRLRYIRMLVLPAPHPGTRQTCNLPKLMRAPEPTAAVASAPAKAAPTRPLLHRISDMAGSLAIGRFMIATVHDIREAKGQTRAQQRQVTRYAAGPFAPVYLAETAGRTGDAYDTIARRGLEVQSVRASESLGDDLKCRSVIEEHWSHVEPSAWDRAAAHIACWQRIADQRQGHGGVVIEPHVDITCDVRELLEALYHRGDTFSLLNLCQPVAGSLWPSPDDPFAGRRAYRWTLDGQRQCSLNLGGSHLAGAYWVTTEGARALLNEVLPLRAPVEHALFGHRWALRRHWSITSGGAPFRDAGHHDAVTRHRSVGGLLHARAAWQHMFEARHEEGLSTASVPWFDGGVPQSPRFARDAARRLAKDSPA